MTTDAGADLAVGFYVVRGDLIQHAREYWVERRARAHAGLASGVDGGGRAGDLKPSGEDARLRAAVVPCRVQAGGMFWFRRNRFVGS